MAQPLRKRSENMSKKLICKIITDVLMLAAMPLLMAYMLVGEKLHEWLGIGIFILFILHHSLNYQWIKNLFRNKYTISRIIKTIVNVLILHTVVSRFHVTFLIIFHSVVIMLSQEIFICFVLTGDLH